MLTHVERKHWYTQLPFSWGVEVILVIALLTGTVFAATQVRGRDATIADQTAVISQQAATIGQQAVTLQQSQEQVLAQRRIAEFDGAIIASYGTLQAHRAAMAKALRGEYSEVYESYEVAAAAQAQAQSRIDMLLAERQVVLTFPYTYETR